VVCGRKGSGFDWNNEKKINLSSKAFGLAAARELKQVSFRSPCTNLEKGKFFK